MKVVIVLSGGLDSTTLLYEYNEMYEMYAIIFDYGQKNKREIKFAVKTCKKLGVEYKIIKIQLDKLVSSGLMNKDIDVIDDKMRGEKMNQTTVPNRNMIFLSYAIAYAMELDAPTILYGAQFGSFNKDNSQEFIDAINNALFIVSNTLITIVAPYINLKKEDIVWRGIRYEVDYSLTYSCYVGKRLSCGKCHTCKLRLEAFEKLGKKDPIRYAERFDPKYFFQGGMY